MKKNLRKMFALMLALALSLTMLQGVAFAVDSYSFVNGVLTISDSGEVTSAEVNDALTKASKTKSDVTEVIIQSATSIGMSAFANCTNLASVSIPDTVTTIGNIAFAETAISSITIPAGVTTIGVWAFQSCGDLTSVTFDGVSKLEKLGESAFNSTGLTTIILPNGLKEIGSAAFYGCTDLTSVTIPNTVNSIGSRAFYKTAIASITLPDGVTLIEDEMFGETTALTSLTIPAGVTKIGEDAFNGSAITSITFMGSKVTDMADEGEGIDVAFRGAKNLANIYFSGAYNADTATMATLLAKALKDAGKTPTINCSPSWAPADIATFESAFTAEGYTGEIKANLPPVPSTGGGSTGGTGGGVGVWYPGQASGGITYTQIIDTPATTAMLQQGSTITVIGGSPTGIIVKLDPTALSGHSTITINNSIGDVTLTATQIANLLQQADGDVIHVTIKQTTDGVAITATAGGTQVTL